MHDVRIAHLKLSWTHNWTLETKYTQSVSLKVSPTSTTYSPTGKSLLYTSSGNQLYSLVLGRGSATENKETWTAPLENLKFNCSRAIFNWAGTALAVVHSAESQIRIVEWPSLVVKEALPAHVGGCTALALHPGGKSVSAFAVLHHLTRLQIPRFWWFGLYCKSLWCRGMDLRPNDFHLRVSTNLLTQGSS